MFVLALLLFLLAVGACLFVMRWSYRTLGIDLKDTLRWLGIAEEPLPRTSRRR